MSLLAQLEKLPDPLSTRRRGDLFKNVLSFCHLLRDQGMEVTPGRIIDTFRGLEVVDLMDRDEFQCALRSNLVSCKEEAEKFDILFQIFWASPLREEERELGRPQDEIDLGEQPGAEKKEQIQEMSSLEEWLESQEGKGEKEEKVATYSPWEVIGVKDFSSFQGDEIRAVRRAVLEIARKLATRVSLRKVPDRRGPQLDLRRSLRRNIRYAGEIVELTRRRRKVKRARLVLICDVSGSMDCYSNFLIQFMYGLQNELTGVETIVFSTRLTRVTHLLKRGDIQDALKQVAAIAVDWSGGTNIGKCLKSFNESLAPDILGPRAVVLILSDGWDRGDPEMLRNEMRRLKSNSYKVIWLNPLLGSSNYQPLCQGMRAALPFTDYFLPVHNLKSLISLGRVIRPLISGH